MNKELAITKINEELELASISNALLKQDIIDHYNDLKQIIKQREESNLTKILVFQPIAAGDIMCSQNVAELLHRKYINAEVHFMTETPEIVPILNNNPFISNVIYTKDWNNYLHSEGYNQKYSLYWWDPPIIKSFYEDCELPTNYCRTRIYINEKMNKIAKEYWENIDPNHKKIRICIQNDMYLKWNYEKFGKELEDGILSFPNVILQKIGLGDNYNPLCENYLQSLELLREADILICPHGSMEHGAVAVGCQTVALSYIYNPEFVSPAYTQNDYRDPKKPCKVVRPQTWCGTYNCVHTNRSASLHKPPHIFPQHRMTPQVHNCNYLTTVKNCIYEIPPSLILQKLKECLDNL